MELCFFFSHMQKQMLRVVKKLVQHHKGNSLQNWDQKSEILFPKHPFIGSEIQVQKRGRNSSPTILTLSSLPFPPYFSV